MNKTNFAIRIPYRVCPIENHVLGISPIGGLPNFFLLEMNVYDGQELAEGTTCDIQFCYHHRLRFFPKKHYFTALVHLVQANTFPKHPSDIPNLIVDYITNRICPHCPENWKCPITYVTLCPSCGHVVEQNL